MDMQGEHLLATQLRACGHFLYYQTGGKAGQRRILISLLKNENLTQKELQDFLEISSGALSEILQKMEDDALIQRRKSCDDKRMVMLTLTQKGRDMSLRVQDKYQYTLERMFECLNRQERIQLGGILEKLVGHLDILKSDPLFETCKDISQPPS